MTFEFWLLYVTTVFVASLVPGPSMLLALSHGTKFGTTRTIATALGNTTASCLQATVAIAGLGAILTVSGTLFMVIKWLGAAYLIYIGVKMWFTSDITSDAEGDNHHDAPIALSKMYGQAFFVAIGNPKAIVFFTALFPQFINANTHQMQQYLILVITLSVIAFISFMIYALGGSQIGGLLKRPQIKKYFKRVVGSVFVGLGINLATSRN